MTNSRAEEEGNEHQLEDLAMERSLKTSAMQGLRFGQPISKNFVSQAEVGFALLSELQLLEVQEQATSRHEWVTGEDQAIPPSFASALVAMRAGKCGVHHGLAGIRTIPGVSLAADSASVQQPMRLEQATQERKMDANLKRELQDHLETNCLESVCALVKSSLQAVLCFEQKDRLIQQRIAELDAPSFSVKLHDICNIAELDTRLLVALYLQAGIEANGNSYAKANMGAWGGASPAKQSCGRYSDAPPLWQDYESCLASAAFCGVKSSAITMAKARVAL
ncbi:hypothetical protein llap_6265 [Limosa lapponica baueri]|uniref:Uncharacterized protein n=1 Tax=Limosa lapponica baueri TaxID=1758121 RepID=A0A2I0UBK9_LIMLA|nr:hypothetical protein llap_6265 [Limosa lapponica baueri]